MEAPLKISVVTAVFNARETINSALASVARQNWTSVEHVVIDGESTDGTLEILRNDLDERAILFSESDRGIYDALNKGILRSTGDVIGFLHADDVYADDLVLERIAAVFADPLVGAVYGDLQYVRRDDLDCVIRHWKSNPFSANKFAWGWMPPHPTLYVRRSWYDRIGVFDTRYRIASDYHMMLRLLSQKELNPVYIPEVLVKMRVGGVSNRSLKNVIRKSREDLDALRRTGVGGLGALAWKNLSKLRQFL